PLLPAHPAPDLQPALQGHHPAARLPGVELPRLPGARPDHLRRGPERVVAPGHITFAVCLGVSWVGITLLMDYHSGYLDKLRVTPINRISILFGEMVPLFVMLAVVAGLIL